MLVSFVPIENVVRVIEKGCYNYYISYSKEGLVNEEVYDYIDNTYSFQMQDETALKYIVDMDIIVKVAMILALLGQRIPHVNLKKKKQLIIKFQKTLN